MINEKDKKYKCRYCGKKFKAHGLHAHEFRCFYNPDLGVKPKMKVISVHLPVAIIRAINKKVEEGFFPNRAEFIRTAIYNALDLS